MTNDEWVKEAERLAERLAMKARREAAYLGGPMAEKYTGERKAAQSLLMLHLSARPEPQAAVSEEAILPLPTPWDYCYEWTGPYGKRKFSAAHHNGRACDNQVPVYTGDQMREFARAVLAASRQVPVGKPLTEDRIIDVTEHIDMEVPGCFIRIARAIERAHGIGSPSPLPAGEPRQEEGERSGVQACQTEQDCNGMPWCRINGKCQRTVHLPADGVEGRKP